LKIENGKLKMNVSPLATISNHLRSKYHNFQFSIFNSQFHAPARQIGIYIIRGNWLHFTAVLAIICKYGDAVF